MANELGQYQLAHPPAPDDQHARLSAEVDKLFPADKTPHQVEQELYKAAMTINPETRPRVKEMQNLEDLNPAYYYDYRQNKFFPKSVVSERETPPEEWLRAKLAEVLPGTGESQADYARADKFVTGLELLGLPDIGYGVTDALTGAYEGDAGKWAKGMGIAGLGALGAAGLKGVSRGMDAVPYRKLESMLTDKYSRAAHIAKLRKARLSPPQDTVSPLSKLEASNWMGR